MEPFQYLPNPDVGLLPQPHILLGRQMNQTLAAIGVHVLRPTTQTTSLWISNFLEQCQYHEAYQTERMSQQDQALLVHFLANGSSKEPFLIHMLARIK